MASKKVNELIKEARTSAGFSQEQLAKKIKGLEASDLSKAERGLLELSDEQLKLIAKACGVTQKSLLEAPKASKKTTAKKTTSKTSSSTSKTTTSTSETLTTNEKTLLNLYRKADSDTKKKVISILKGEETNGLESIVTNILGNIGGLDTSKEESTNKKKTSNDLLGNLLGNDNVNDILTNLSKMLDDKNK